MTLQSVLEAWRLRYGLERYELAGLATEVSRHLDQPLSVHPPMPSPIARKLRVRTYSEAIRRVLAERLLGGPGLLARPRLVVVDSPKEEAEPTSEAKPKRRRYRSYNDWAVR